MFETTNQNNSIGHPTRNGRKSSQKILTAPCLQEPISAMENILQDLSSKSIAGSAPSDFWASHPKHHEKLQCSWNSYGFMNYMIYYIYILYITHGIMMPMLVSVYYQPQAQPKNHTVKQLPTCSLTLGFIAINTCPHSDLFTLW